MMTQSTTNLRIQSFRPLISPAILLEEIPVSESATATMSAAREMTDAIIKGRDDRLLVIAGPCSIHDTDAALDYARHLKQAAEEYRDHLGIIMRVYFEKPRTTIGWKGLINDPDLNNSFAINRGLHIARKLLLDINELGLACGTEFLDTIIPQFISDLIAWGAIGARTTESQIHRELVSGLSMPVGFKNGTGGDIKIAIDAVKASSHPHHFLGVTPQGLPSIVATKGNDQCHVILRGSSSGPNYSADHIQQVTNALDTGGVRTGIMVDCSHGNSRKDYRQQPVVATDLAQQIASGNDKICGIMLESHLEAGNQPLGEVSQLKYGQSITDACISWSQTEKVLAQLAAAVAARREIKGQS